MTEHKENLADLWEEVWRHLEAGVSHRGAAARYLALATIGRFGRAEARMVVLRAALRGPGKLAIHTDRLTAKVAELEVAPGATLLAWVPEARVQIRMCVQISIRPGTEAEWAQIPVEARRAFGGTPPPGILVATPNFDRGAGLRDRFAVLDAVIDHVDVLVLGEDGHQRAAFTRSDNWTGHWLMP